MCRIVGSGRAGERRGFTLIEVLVVLAIMALLIGILMPVGSRQREHAVVANGAQQIAQALRLTRSRAITANQPMSFGVDVKKALWRAAGAAAPQPVPSGTRIALTTTTDQVSSAAVGAIRFYPDGSSTGGGVALTSAATRYDILVDWLTGAVSVHEHHEPPHR